MLKEPIPIQDYLPSGPLKEVGERYVHGLPNVETDPLTPQSLMQQSDYSWTDYAVAYLLLYPWAVILLGLLGGLGVWLYFRRCKRREEAMRPVCRECGTAMYPCGLYCPKCNALNPEPLGVNWVGFSKPKVKIPEDEREKHKQILRSFRRCHHCGRPLDEDKIDQHCPDCGRPVLTGAATVKEFDELVSRRRGWTYAVVTVLGLIPILGPLLASFLYRRTIVAPYGQYMHVFKESFVMVVLLVLRHVFRLIPFIGMIGMPLLCVAEYHMYRKMFLWKADKVLGINAEE